MARREDDALPSWSLREARKRLSAVIEAARGGRPQLVTSRGAPVAVVIAAADYERLRSIEQRMQPSFVAHLLAMPSDDGTFERIEGEPRPPCA